MSATLSEATGRPYGIQRVCQAWERSRSALYARQTREQQRHKGEEPARRGPTPTVSDATLLEAIQADLDRRSFRRRGGRLFTRSPPATCEAAGEHCQDERLGTPRRLAAPELTRQ